MIQSVLCFKLKGIGMSDVHAELKKLYAEDAKHSETPWEYWEFKNIFGRWVQSSDEPMWYANSNYRRRDDAPDWSTWYMGQSMSIKIDSTPFVVNANPQPKSIHDTLKEVLQKHYDETGVKITSVHTEWVNGTVGNHLLYKVEVQSEK